MTCHIVVMRHTVSGVVSLGHFDNFCCWQFGEDSSAHRDGLDIMVDEISTLSCGNVDSIEVSVVGGYTDVRGDAAKNSLSLLNSLHQHWAYLNLVHFCVGKYNTQANLSEGRYLCWHQFSFVASFPAIWRDFFRRKYLVKWTHNGWNLNVQWRRWKLISTKSLRRS